MDKDKQRKEWLRNEEEKKLELRERYLMRHVADSFNMEVVPLPPHWTLDYFICRREEVHAICTAICYPGKAPTDILIDSHKFEAGCTWAKNCGTTNRDENCAFLIFVSGNNGDYYYKHNPSNSRHIMTKKFIKNPEAGDTGYRTAIPLRLFKKIPHDNGKVNT